MSVYKKTISAEYPDDAIVGGFGDGVRAMLIVGASDVTLWAGLGRTAVPANIVPEAAALPCGRYHGEVVSDSDDVLSLVLFDVDEVGGVRFAGKPTSERRAALQLAVPQGNLIRIADSTLEMEALGRREKESPVGGEDENAKFQADYLIAVAEAERDAAAEAEAEIRVAAKATQERRMVLRYSEAIACGHSGDYAFAYSQAFQNPGCTSRVAHTYARKAVPLGFNEAADEIYGVYEGTSDDELSEALNAHERDKETEACTAEEIVERVTASVGIPQGTSEGQELNRVIGFGLLASVIVLVIGVSLAAEKPRRQSVTIYLPDGTTYDCAAKPGMAAEVCRAAIEKRYPAAVWGPPSGWKYITPAVRDLLTDTGFQDLAPTVKRLVLESVNADDHFVIGLLPSLLVALRTDGPWAQAQAAAWLRPRSEDARRETGWYQRDCPARNVVSKRFEYLSDCFGSRVDQRECASERQRTCDRWTGSEWTRVAAK